MGLNLIKDLVVSLNTVSEDFILKGEAALALYFGLTRVPTVIEFDTTTGVDLHDFMTTFCNSRGYTYSVTKNAKKHRLIYHINYAVSKSIDVRVYNCRTILPTEYTKVSGILVYPLTRILAMKICAFADEEKITDLFDIIYICKNFWKDIPDYLKFMLTDTFACKGDLMYLTDLVAESDSKWCEWEKTIQGVPKIRFQVDLESVYRSLGLK